MDGVDFQHTTKDVVVLAVHGSRRLCFVKEVGSGRIRTAKMTRPTECYKRFMKEDMFETGVLI